MSKLRRVPNDGANSAMLGLGAEAFAGTRRLALTALVVIASLGFVGAFFTILAVKIVLCVIAFASLLGFVLLKTSNSLAQSVATYFSAAAETEEKSLDEAKDQLAEALRTLSRPMLVVVDDVDRLTGPEIRLLFQLLKPTRTFPTWSTWCSFNRKLSSKFLQRNYPLTGAST